MTRAIAPRPLGQDGPVPAWTRRAPAPHFRTATDRAVRQFGLYTLFSVAIVLVTFLFLGGAVLWVALPALRWLTLPSVLLMLVCSVWMAREALPLQDEGDLAGPPWAAVAGTVAAGTVLTAVPAWAAEEPRILPMMGYTAMSVAMMLGLAVRWRLAGTLACVPALAACLTLAVRDLRLVPMSAVGLGIGLGTGLFIGYCSAWAMSVVRAQARHHRVAADLAVAEERLRFSRDLHDVLGRTLSVVALKSELAGELARRGDGEAAAAETDAVRCLAQEAADDLRGVVRGYRRMDPAAELEGAVALLRSSGAEVHVEGAEHVEHHPGWPPATSEAVGWVLREGVTNVLRHSDARTVHLAVRPGPTDVSLELVNDRPRQAPTGPDAGSRPRGTGLAGLRERLRQAGGHLATHPTADRFTLVATLPTDAPPTPAPSPQETR